MTAPGDTPMAKVTISTAGPCVMIEAAAPWGEVADRAWQLYRDAAELPVRPERPGPGIGFRDERRGVVPGRPAPVQGWCAS